MKRNKTINREEVSNELCNGEKHIWQVEAKMNEKENAVFLTRVCQCGRIEKAICTPVWNGVEE